MEGRVIKILANNFFVQYDKDVFLCSPCGKTKKDRIFVGDRVEFAQTTDRKPNRDASTRSSQFVISKVQKRRNLLIRPPISNLDKLVILIAPVPEPDFLNVDKLILFALSNDVEPILVLNKIDICDEKLKNYVLNTYQNVLKTLCVSAYSGYNMKELESLLSEGTSAFAGQSAVGKSSIINFLSPEKSLIGDLSKRINRGKNTTRFCQIFPLKNGGSLCDTPGFSSLDEKLLPFKYDALSSYYPDFLSYASFCKFGSSCTHTKEKDCGIKTAVCNHDLDEGRFMRFQEIYQSLYKRWTNDHK